jgi:hypothetical protein
MPLQGLSRNISGSNLHHVQRRHLGKHAALTANVRANLAEVTCITSFLDCQSFLEELVGEHAGSIAPSAEDQGSIGLLCTDDSFFHTVMNRSFNGAHKSSTHIDSFGSES